MDNESCVCEMHDRLDAVPKEVAACNGGERADTWVPAKRTVGTQGWETEAAKCKRDDEEGMHEGRDVNVPSQWLQDGRRAKPSANTHQLLRSRLVLSRP